MACMLKRCVHSARQRRRTHVVDVNRYLSGKTRDVQCMAGLLAVSFPIFSVRLSVSQILGCNARQELDTDL